VTPLRVFYDPTDLICLLFVNALVVYMHAKFEVSIASTVP